MGMDVGEDEDCACCALEAPRCRNGLRIGLGSAFGTAIAGAGVFCPPTGGTAAHPHTLPGGFVARLGRSAARAPATARDPDCGCQRKCLGQFIVNHKDIYTRLVSSIDMHRLGTEQSKSVKVLVSDCGPHQHNQFMVSLQQWLVDHGWFSVPPPL
jgi:hypothetical protein